MKADRSPPETTVETEPCLHAMTLDSTCLSNKQADICDISVLSPLRWPQSLGHCVSLDLPLDILKGVEHIYFRKDSSETSFLCCNYKPEGHSGCLTHCCKMWNTVDPTLYHTTCQSFLDISCHIACLVYSDLKCVIIGNIDIIWVCLEQGWATSGPLAKWPPFVGLRINFQMWISES